MYLNKQDFEYVLGPKYGLSSEYGTILKMHDFWMKCKVYTRF